MRKIDWASKLTSRKFWMALAGLVSGLVIAFGGSEATSTQITALLMSAASVVAFVLGEGWVDAADAKSPTVVLGEEKDKPPEGTEEE